MCCEGVLYRRRHLRIHVAAMTVLPPAPAIFPDSIPILFRSVEQRSPAALPQQSTKALRASSVIEPLVISSMYWAAS